MENYKKVCELYKNGFKCIKYAEEKDGSMNIYFKNFKEEKSDSVEIKDSDEKIKIKNFIKQNTIQ